MSSLQMVELEDIVDFLNKEEYWCIPVTREELDSLKEGILKPTNIVSAFKDSLVLKVRWDEFVESGRVFILLVRGSELVNFKKVEIVPSAKEIKTDYQKYEDGMEEYRLKEESKLDVVCYAVLNIRSQVRNEWADSVLSQRANYGG